jgi:hypothetical protein
MRFLDIVARALGSGKFAFLCGDDSCADLTSAVGVRTYIVELAASPITDTAMETVRVRLRARRQRCRLALSHPALRRVGSHLVLR